ncbi:MAG TPA: hypothetical protein VNA25_02170 [Phycisphaerae bacterium]|nr:hypothetical protein [Phycisphaerae bacterium]
MRSAKVTILLAVVLLSAQPVEARKGIAGDAALLVGGIIWPRSSFGEQARPGFVAEFRWTGRFKSVEFLSIWGSLSAFRFSLKDRSLEAASPDGPIPVTQQTRYVAFGGHIGAQIDSPSRRSVVRPRAGVGICWYGFNKDDSFTRVGESAPYHDAGTGGFRLGWRAIVGADFYFFPKGGLALDFLYQEMWHLPQPSGSHVDESTLRFLGIALNILVKQEVIGL